MGPAMTTAALEVCSTALKRQHGLYHPFDGVLRYCNNRSNNLISMRGSLAVYSLVT